MTTEKKIRTIIVDDAGQARELLRLMINELTKKINVVGEAENLDQAVELIKVLKPDLVFLDIEMPGRSGLQILEAVTKSQVDFEIIFTTAYNQYAIQAFRLSAIDYLLKPIREAELLDAIKRAEVHILNKESSKRLKALSDNLKIQGNNVLCLPVNYGYDYIPVSEIEYLEADGSYAHIYMRDGKKKTISKNLKYFEEAIQHIGFFIKVHRSCIINLNYMASFNKSERGFITLQSGKEVNLSRGCRAEFLEKLETFGR